MRKNRKKQTTNKKVIDFFWRDEFFSIVDSVFLIVFVAILIRVVPKHGEILKYAFYIMMLPGVFYMLWLGQRFFTKNHSGKLWRRYLSLSLMTSVIILGLVSLLLLK